MLRTHDASGLIGVKQLFRPHPGKECTSINRHAGYVATHYQRFRSGYFPPRLTDHGTEPMLRVTTMIGNQIRSAPPIQLPALRTAQAVMFVC